MSIVIELDSPVAAPNYAALIALVATTLDRDDLTARIPAWIELAHRRFNRVLWAADRETYVTFVISGQSYAIGYRVSKIVSLIVLNGDDTPLRQIPLDELKRDTEITDRPTRYALSGRTLYFDPQPDSLTLQMIYEGEIPLLSTVNISNWVLDNHPDLYLYGALVQAEAALGDDARVSLWKSALDEAIGEVIDADMRRKYGSGPLVMKLG